MKNDIRSRTNSMHTHYTHLFPTKFLGSYKSLEVVNDEAEESLQVGSFRRVSLTVLQLTWISFDIYC